MEQLTGKLKKIIFKSDNGYLVALFRVQKSSDNLKELVGKTITVTGVIVNENEEQTYILDGDYILNPKYGYQFNFNSYNVFVPNTADAIIEYLSSSLIKGCGKKTAVKIVELLGDDAINIIKTNPIILKKLNISDSKITKIYDSIMANVSTDDLIINLKELGFTINECSKIIKKYGDKVNYIIENNIYLLNDIIDFNKIDKIFLLNHDASDKIRQEACILEALNNLSLKNGDTYSYYEEIEQELYNFNISLDNDVLNELIDRELIIKIDNNYFLKDNYIAEENVADMLYEISNRPLVKKYDLDKYINQIEFESGLKYNNNQKDAIAAALNNRIAIISGGPGTGKTTIINAIVRIYIMMNKLNPIDVYDSIALLAPTGRASKKITSSTNLPAQTIHRYLKWNKESDTFGINEYNKLHHKLVIIDEVSMIDIHLFNALLKGLTSNVQLILVGDVFQLPSVGAGLVLSNIIDSNLFNYNPLEEIFRQSKDSYIPYLAKEIKNEEIGEELFKRKDDYNFLEAKNNEIKNMISQICNLCLKKELKSDIQILAPLYKGINGIDNLNSSLREIFNPLVDQAEIKIGDIIYREKDKVLQLVNNPDLNVYNGDIGYIKEISKNEITIDFEGNYVIYSKSDMQDITHAYAISIHKSQGSEFSHVIIPIESHYQRMLYNKLIYTGVSRAKKSLVIVGEKDALIYAIKNNYANHRKTYLLELLLHIFSK